MRAFICEVDSSGLRSLLPEDAMVAGDFSRYLQRRFPRPTTIVWALLQDEDADAVREDVHDERHGDACRLLLNRAIELISIGAAGHGPNTAGT